jgi:hypothetical protein
MIFSLFRRLDFVNLYFRGEDSDGKSAFKIYSRAYGSYQDFLDRGLLLTRKLLNQG